MLLSLSTWKEIENYLQTNKGIIIPIGSTEQHGPMGHIGTDAICPEKIAQEISKQFGILVAPTINYGMSQHHLAFAGSVTLRPSTLTSILKDIILSFSYHGFTHVFFLNGHGGNVASIDASFSEVYSDFSLTGVPCNIKCLTMGWYEGKRVSDICDRYFPDCNGSHATPAEVSLSFYTYPEATKSAKLDPEIAPQGCIRDAADYKKRFPDGRIGSNSAMANKEIGAELCEAAVKDVMDCYRSFLKDDDN